MILNEFQYFPVLFSFLHTTFMEDRQFARYVFSLPHAKIISIWRIIRNFPLGNHVNISY